MTPSLTKVNTLSFYKQLFDQSQSLFFRWDQFRMHISSCLSLHLGAIWRAVKRTFFDGCPTENPTWLLHENTSNPTLSSIVYTILICVSPFSFVEDLLSVCCREKFQVFEICIILWIPFQLISVSISSFFYCFFFYVYSLINIHHFAILCINISLKFHQYPFWNLKIVNNLVSVNSFCSVNVFPRMGRLIHRLKIIHSNNRIRNFIVKWL